MKFYTLIIFFIALPLFISADIEGNYEVEGKDPVVGSYTGKAVIERKAVGIYTARWTFTDGTSAEGTGVKQMDTISFVFKESSGDFGTQLYEIRDNLEGKYIRFGASQNGWEKMLKIKN